MVLWGQEVDSIGKTFVPLIVMFFIKDRPDTRLARGRAEIRTEITDGI